MAQINTSRTAVATSATTTSATFETISTVTNTLDLNSTAHIVATLVFRIFNTSGASASCEARIDIDGTKSPAISREITDTRTGTISVVFRTPTALASGTHTITAEWRRVSGTGTISGDNFTLIGIAMDTDDGRVIPSMYATGTDSTSSSPVTNYEDMDGVSGTISLIGTNHVVGLLAASVSTNTANVDASIALDINGQFGTNRRTSLSDSEDGSMGVGYRTSTTQSGSITVKGMHAVQSGTFTVDPAILTAFEAGIGSNNTIPTGQKFVAQTAHTSATLADIGGLSTTVTLTETSHIFAVMTLESFLSTVGNNGQFAININGTDHFVYKRTQKSSLERFSVVIYARTATKLPPSTYTIKGRMAREAIIPVGGAVAALNANLIAMGAEATGGSSSSSSASSSSSSSLSSSSSSLSSASSSSSLSSASSSSSSSSDSSSSSSSSSSASSSSSSSSLSLVEINTGVVDNFEAETGVTDDSILRINLEDGVSE